MSQEDTTGRQLYKLLPQDGEIPVITVEEFERDSTLMQPDLSQPFSINSREQTPVKRKPIPPPRSRSVPQWLGEVLSNPQSMVENERIPNELVSNDADIPRRKPVPAAAPKGWPLAPSSLSQSDYWATSADVLMCIGAILFLVLAMLSASVHSTYPGLSIKYYRDGPIIKNEQQFYPNATFGPLGSRVPSLTNKALNLRLLQVIRFGPTVFPILFAGIISSGIRQIARWKAEKGSTIKTLEVLVGSRSLASTISTVFSLGTIGLLPVGIITLWALSPLAGQSSLRVLSIRNVTDANVAFPWAVQDSTDLSTIDPSRFLDLKSFYISAVALSQTPGFAMVGQRLLIPRTQSNESWRKPEAFVPNTTNANGLYLPTPIPDRRDDCTSLLDLSIVGPINYLPAENQWRAVSGFGISYDSNIRFPVARYEFMCPSMSEHSANTSWVSLLGTNSVFANTSYFTGADAPSSGFFLDTNASLISADEGPQEFVFASFSMSTMLTWRCLLYLNIRNISTSCGSISPSGFSCQLQSMDVPKVTTRTPFNDLNITANLLRFWPLVDAATPGYSSLTEQFLAYGLNSSGQRTVVDLSQLDNVTFAARLSTIFNTWIGSTQTATTPRPTEVTWQLLGGLTGIDITDSTTPVKVLPFEIVACNWLFFAILTATSVLLILCCVFSIWLRRRLSTPDVLGYVSSSTIDNAHACFPGVELGSGSALDGLERARLLGVKRVQIRDVLVNERVGKFALTSEMGEPSATKVEKQRRYL